MKFVAIVLLLIVLLLGVCYTEQTTRDKKDSNSDSEK